MSPQFLGIMWRMRKELILGPSLVRPGIKAMHGYDLLRVQFPCVGRNSEGTIFCGSLSALSAFLGAVLARPI